MAKAAKHGAILFLSIILGVGLTAAACGGGSGDDSGSTTGDATGDPTGSTTGDTTGSTTGDTIDDTDPAVTFIASESRIWLKADAITNVESGDRISLWEGSSASGFDATLVSLSKRPTYVTNAVNMLPAVSFGGTSQLVLSDPGVLAEDDTTVDFKFFVVYGNHDAAPIVGGWQTLFANNAEYPYLGITFSKVSWFSVADSENDAYPAGLDFHLLAFLKGSSGVTIWQDGVQIASDSTYTGPINTAGDTTYYIGDNTEDTGPDQALTGDIAEMIIFESVLDAASETLINCYLAEKYALTITGCD